jgi:homoserine kinase type II
VENSGRYSVRSSRVSTQTETPGSLTNVAIYTELTNEQWSTLAEAYGLGALHSVHGIPQGSINSNFRLEAQKGKFFLRHTLVRKSEDLRFEAGLLGHLAESHFPGPVIEPTVRGEPFVEIAGGRVTLFHLLAGEELRRNQLSDEHLEQLGRELGKLHRLGASFTGQRENPYGLPVVASWLEGLRGVKDPEVAEALTILEPALAEAKKLIPSGLLPRGPIHADVFLDNVKWLGDRISAIFDFEMACVDACALDVAITLNAWCFDGDYLPLLARRFIVGYQEQRPLSGVERGALYGQALFGAVRYTASRIRDFHLSPLGPDKLTKKDFRTYLARVKRLQMLGPEMFQKLVGL